jgi:hypothetical protein
MEEVWTTSVHGAMRVVARRRPRGVPIAAVPDARTEVGPSVRRTGSLGPGAGRAYSRRNSSTAFQPCYFQLKFDTAKREHARRSHPSARGAGRRVPTLQAQWRGLSVQPDRPFQRKAAPPFTCVATCVAPHVAPRPRMFTRRRVERYCRLPCLRYTIIPNVTPTRKAVPTTSNTVSGLMRLRCSCRARWATASR